MAEVNGVEIKVGQVWRTRGGGAVTVVEHDSADSSYPWRTIAGDQDAIWVTNSGREYQALEGNDDLIELVKDEKGFTIWHGGEQPVETIGKTVEYRYERDPGSDGPADRLHWTHTGLTGDIHAYKVVEEAAQADSATLVEETLIALGWTFDGQAWVEQSRIELVTPTPTMQEPGYELLAYVLERAYNQAALGKGKERHANGEPFDEQVMQDGARRFGVGALLFQAFKKSEESQRLPLDRGVNELLGAIVYLAGAVIRREADALEGGV